MSEANIAPQEAIAKRLSEITGAIEALSEGVALFDAEDQLVLCNASFRAAHPHLSEFLVPGLPWSILVAEASRRGADRSFDQVGAYLASDSKAPFSLEANRPGGRRVRLGVNPTAEGGFVLTEADTTDALVAEELRAEAGNLLREVLDACAPQIAMCRIGDGEILYRTPAWTALFGSRSADKGIYPDPAGRSDLLTELLPTGAVEGFETTLLRADGTTFPARISARVVEYEGEDVIVSSIQDMTLVYAQRDEIIRTNQRLLDAIEALDQGIALFDNKDRLVLANDHFVDVNGPIAQYLKPGTANSQIIAAARKAGLEPRAAGWPDRDDRLPSRFDFSLPDGRCFAAHRCAMSDSGFVIAWTDVSERKAAERALVEERETSHQNEKLTALGELLAGVAHELNNPLSVVVGQALMLHEEADDAGIVRRVGMISDAAERCAKIVKTFLAMARQKPTRLEPTDIVPIVETALDVVSYALRNDGVAVETDFGVDLPRVLADSDQITQVFVNLLVNAGHAVEGRKNPRILVATYHDRARNLVVATVTDNGPGVPEELRARIFEPFFTTKSVGQGTGIGLAMSHRIVSTHGGMLELCLGTERGAQFKVSLPVTTEVSPEAGEPMEKTRARGRAALIVEDEAPVAETIADILRGLGVTTVHAASGEEAIEILRTEHTFDLILSDVKMPGLGGEALLVEIERHWPHLVGRFAFVTGDAMGADPGGRRSLSGRPVLEKPLAPGDIREVLHTLAENGS